MSPSWPQLRPSAGLPLAVVLIIAVTLTACSSSSRPHRVEPSAPATSAAATASGGPSGQVAWLCRPGQEPEPCDTDVDTTVVAADGTTHVQRVAPAARPPIDCFYVYPTVSQASGLNAPLRSAPEIVATVRAQAAQFARACRLFVPLYRQVTVAALTSGRFYDVHANALAQSDLEAAWHDYLAHYNDGRGVVLIGHSQGAMRLTKLIQSDIDADATQRRLLVSAILLGGNVTVPDGKLVGGDFKHVPVCTRATETGCLVAYSSFARTPPTVSFFGRAAIGRQVVCVSPSALLHQKFLSPVVPTKRTAGAILSGGLRSALHAPTGYVSFPGVLTASCVDDANAHVLFVKGSIDGRPIADLQTLGAAWGLHLIDVNVDLGALVQLVQREAASYTAATH